MAERVLSIEMGYSLTKVCEVEKSGKSPKIFNSFVIATPEGVLRDGAVEINDEFINQFLRMMTVKRIKTRRAIFTISSSKIATREAVIPYVKENKIADIVRANLSEYFPIDTNQYMFSHSILSVEREEIQVGPVEEAKDEKANEQGGDDNDKKKAKAAKPVVGKPTGYKLLVLAAPKQLIQSYERLAKAIGLEIDSIDYNGNSIYQAAKEECKDGVQLIIKVDERSSLLMVLEDGVTALNRTIPYGIDEALATLGQCTELGDTKTYEKALEVARRKTVILSSFDEGSSAVVDMDNETKDELLRSEKKAVTESLRPLVGGIIRVIDYYNANHSQRPIDKMFVTGIGADFSGLSNLLTHEAGLKIKNLTHLAGIDIEKVFKEVTYGEYVTCIGAAIAPLTFYPDHEDKNKNGGGSGALSGVDPMIIGLVVLIVGLLTAIVLVVMTIVPYLKEKKLHDGYEKTIEELQPSYDIYLQCKAEEANAAYLQKIDDTTVNRNDELKDFIATLESGMPQSFYLDNLNANEEGITMEATVSTKVEVAYVLDKLKENPSFATVDITDVSVDENEVGEIVYNFTIEIFYAPLFEDEAAAPEEVPEEVVEAEEEE